MACVSFVATRTARTSTVATRPRPSSPPAEAMASSSPAAILSKWLFTCLPAACPSHGSKQIAFLHRTFLVQASDDRLRCLPSLSTHRTRLCGTRYCPGGGSPSHTEHDLPDLPSLRSQHLVVAAPADRTDRDREVRVRPGSERHASGASAATVRTHPASLAKSRRHCKFHQVRPAAAPSALGRACRPQSRVLGLTFA